MSDEQKVQAAEAILDAFSQQVPLRPERLPTFMEITGTRITRMCAATFSLFSLIQIIHTGSERCSWMLLHRLATSRIRQGR